MSKDKGKRPTLPNVNWKELKPKNWGGTQLFTPEEPLTEEEAKARVAQMEIGQELFDMARRVRQAANGGFFGDIDFERLMLRVNRAKVNIRERVAELEKVLAEIDKIVPVLEDAIAAEHERESTPTERED